jgi:hypothetical protein
LTAVAVLLGSASIQLGHTPLAVNAYTSQSSGLDACTGTLNGARFPQVIPTFFVWDRFWTLATSDPAFADRLANDVAINPPVIKEILRIATDVRQQVRALRAPGSPGSPAPSLDEMPPERQRGAARSILSGQDALIRLLPKADYDRLQGLVLSLRSDLRYRVPGQGYRRLDFDDGPVCSVSVLGRDYPQLIPEPYTWETYFRIRAGAASSERNGNDYSSRHVQTIQRVDIPIAEQYIIHLLRLSTSTNEQVNAIRESASQKHLDYNQMQEQLTETVLDARDELIRALPPAAWEAVLDDVARVPAGTTYDFPADVNP